MLQRFFICFLSEIFFWKYKRLNLHNEPVEGMNLPFAQDVARINRDAQQNKMVEELMIVHHLISIVNLILETMHAM